MIRKNRAFTLIELMVVMLIIGIGLMSVTPSIVDRSVSTDNRLDFFNTLIDDHLVRAIELGRPVLFIGFKGSANIQTHDGKSLTIPNTKSIQEAKVNGYETRGLEYAIRIYPDGVVDYFELQDSEEFIIESLPLLMSTRYLEEIE